ncbi:hypothetical protein [Luteipulveratus mongoliensis]|uniref:Uncharacterized protein n=1 Tax=Luteipulveratus mongoliensis TaxID=571913 RepID=A0A0K1JNA1_9MICO|nr:hypothetical protein [Luteipulveratus mongoliensis]AKU18194.1 hypothetical protein VV02_24000 [Luteipulveratus mongoliensis]
MVTFLGSVVVFAIVLVLVFVIAVHATAAWVDYQERQQQHRLLRELHRADADVADAARDAKRQMNRAAGQSWRNPFE